ncbi:outer membrane protein assembly factor BamB family protein [Humisphaera borealis]|uniref:PQQ-binding-like beta-propeller repeat protein n=1 Tax=Humisphaera borealis TaxID=2807512 RepID=A0A7M2WTN9_9BACT|nr:PQQ-binding-like beta-propeller repeat protein [Humisphaera borealis]QOV88634.1 PQQ-binding-like beta-propeller repeat protein [Humisphaera borealis]
MIYHRSFAIALLCLSAGVLGAEPSWTDFRGPQRNGHADPAAKPPIKWSDSEGFKWKTPIAGSGYSSPIIRDGRIWLTSALGNGASLHAVCVDLASGKILHDVEVFKTSNPGPKHNHNSFASPSPAVDDERVYVSFGTHGVAALDVKTAKPIWTNRDFSLDFLTGAGSTPILYNDLLIIECDAVNSQYVIALDKKTGKQAWKTARSKQFPETNPNKRRAFSTAIVETVAGRDVLLSIGAQRAYGYDPVTGRELFFVDHPGYSNVCRPLVSGGLLILSSCYDRSEMLAVKLPAELKDGDKPIDLGKQIAWNGKVGIPYKPSVLQVNDRLYMVADTGVARCVDPKTGDVLWTKRLGQAYSASPLYAGGHIYFLSEKGDVHVIKPTAGTEPEVVSEFKTEDGFMASPAVAGNALILRSTGSLYRVE